MEFLATDIAALIAGKVIGDSQVKISQVCGIEDGKPGGLSFLGEEKLIHFLESNKASAVIISEKLVPKQEVNPTLIVVEDARLAFGKLLQFYEEQMKQRNTGLEEFAKIDASVVLDESVYIGSFAYVAKGVKIGKNTEIHPQVFVGEGTEIGESCILYSGVKIYPNTKIGNGVVIHSGTVIGSDGFGYNANQEGVFEKVPQIGNVEIHDDVEIGANCTIDRAVLGSTVIGKGVKIDNLVHLAHNVQIGEHAAFAAQVGVAGSTKIGKHVQIGGQVGIAGHIEIKDFVKIMAQSGVGQTVEQRQIIFGSPAIPARQFKKAHVIFKNLPELSNRLDKLEDKVTSNG